MGWSREWVWGLGGESYKGRSLKELFVSAAYRGGLYLGVKVYRINAGNNYMPQDVAEEGFDPDTAARWRHSGLGVSVLFLCWSLSVSRHEYTRTGVKPWCS